MTNSTLYQNIIKLTSHCCDCWKRFGYLNKSWWGSVNTTRVNRCVMYASIFLLTPASSGHWFKQDQNYLWGIYQNYLAALYTHRCCVRYPKSTKISPSKYKTPKLIRQKTPLNRPSGYKPGALQCLSFDEMIVQNFGWAHCIWRSSCWTWWPSSTFVSLLMSFIGLFGPVLSSASRLRSFAKWNNVVCFAMSEISV